MNNIFLADLLMNIAVIGFTEIYKEKKHLILEMILQVACFVLYIYFFAGDMQHFARTVGQAMTIYFVRLVRTGAFFSELQQFQVILSTLKKFTTPFMIMSMNLYTLFYTYAYIGEFIWGGKVTTKSE